MLIGLLLPLLLVVLVRNRIETVIGILGTVLGLAAPLIGVAAMTIPAVDKGTTAGRSGRARAAGRLWHRVGADTQ